MIVVLSENFLPHITKRSSMDGPNSSITIRLDLYSLPCQKTLGKPYDPYMFFSIFASDISCRCLAFSSSFFIA